MAIANDNLKRLIVALEVGETIPQEISDWLLDGAGKYKMLRGKTSLCVCLGLRGRGKDSAETIDAREERDRWLIEAMKHTNIDGVVSWESCKRLSKAIKRFQSVTWIRIKDTTTPPDDALKRCLFFAFKTGISVPESSKQLRNIAKKYGVLISQELENN